jgi:hypothetical protein
MLYLPHGGDLEFDRIRKIKNASRYANLNMQKIQMPILTLNLQLLLK